MKLQELATTKPTKQIAKVFESYFGSRMSFDKLTGAEASKMLKRVRGVLGETRRQPSFHKSEQNPAYLKLVMMEQALTARLKEVAPAVAAPGAAAGVAAQAAGAAQTAGATQAADAAATIAATKDPKVKMALEKAAKGQSLNPDEQKIVAGQALMKTTESLRRAYQMLKESEVQQAQVVLAAQDMVDKMQKMIEDTTSLQFKELPALVDSIKNQVGMDQAQQFNTDATAALAGLVQNLQGSKQQMEQALGVVTGQAVAPGANIGADMGAAVGADLGGAPGAELGAEVGGDLGAAVGDELEAPMPDEEIPPPPKAALGRGRR
jgi:hypothetical protein